MIKESICQKTMCFRSRQNTSQFKRDLAKAIRQSNELFTQSTKELSQSMLAMASGIRKSVAILSQALSNQKTASKSTIHISKASIYSPANTTFPYLVSSTSKKRSAISVIFFFKCTRFSKKSQGGELTTLMNSELCRHNHNKKNQWGESTAVTNSKLHRDDKKD